MHFAHVCIQNSIKYLGQKLYIFITQLRPALPIGLFFFGIVCLLVCEGGTLTSIEDPSEQEFIHRNIKQFQDDHYSYWIGLFRTHSGTVAIPVPISFFIRV